MKVRTFPHDVVEELHDGDAAVRVAVEQLGVNSGCEEFSGGKREEEINCYFLLPCHFFSLHLLLKHFFSLIQNYL